MIEVRVSDARRDFSEHINRVAYGNERIVFTRHGKGVVALVSVADAEILQRLEDAADLAIVRERLEDGDASEYIPHDKVVADLIK
ncbi:MAG: type II toxin-antitoxin system Phd/YefM family antitoxin [Chloroflexota bacterium]|nr:type II toxin-antitoxin system Phd/YefM family antitoxin [Chloroflexota bacterium]